MRVTIASVVDSRSGAVEFHTEFGVGIGSWTGALPSPGVTLDVEFGVETVLRCGSDMVVVQEVDTPRISAVPEGTIITGQLERNEQDGVAIIRMGHHVLMLEFEGEPLPPSSWSRAGPIPVSLDGTNG